MRHRFLRHLQFLWALLAFGVMLVLLWTMIQGYRVSDAPLPAQLGNTFDQIAALRTGVNPKDITFAALGDVKQGTATFTHLLDLAAQDNVDFAVVLGDFVSDPEVWRHYHFMEQIRQADPPFPILLVPGNHDVWGEGPVTEDVFVTLYGQSEFDFVIGRNLFIVLNNVDPYDDDGRYLEFLRNSVTRHRNAVDHIFVFQHVPPAFVNSQIRTRPLDHGEAFVKTCEELGVDYVFTGDHHGYVKTTRGPTTFIVTEGRGDRLRGEHGKFHHFSRVHISDLGVVDSLIAVQKQPEVLQRIERNLILHVFPLMKRSGLTVLATVLTMLVLFGIGVLSLRKWRRSRRRMRSNFGGLALHPAQGK